jgi:hypothetical protein
MDGSTAKVRESFQNGSAHATGTVAVVVVVAWRFRKWSGEVGGERGRHILVPRKASKLVHEGAGYPA